MDTNEAKIVYWHRELPPLDADLVAEHTLEANSTRVPGTIAHRDELWDQCYRELMANAEKRLVHRLAGKSAHVARDIPHEFGRLPQYTAETGRSRVASSLP